MVGVVRHTRLVVGGSVPNNSGRRGGGIGHGGGSVELLPRVIKIRVGRSGFGGREGTGIEGERRGRTRREKKSEKESETAGSGE